MHLTQNFTLEEFVRSATATAHHIDNTPSENVIANLKALCENVLQPLRNQFGAITIGSGFRCAKVNKLVHGASNSQHMTGEAADIHLPTIALGKQWFEWLSKNVVFDQLIWERDSPTSSHYWIHVSFKRNGANRKQVIPLLNKYPK